ncbi:MAG: hypothetical protein IKO79_06885 [Butyrivibrio sp.]|nr:hypothetical protein [Butyrivibrio sp.]
MMSLVFDKNIPATELVLRIILKRDIIVKSVEGQEEYKNPLVGGRDITLDIHAIDIDGEEIDIEVQGNSEGAHVRRARFHSAMMDSRMLREKDAFNKIKDFNSSNSNEMHYKELADSVHHFKETRKGRIIMCEAVKKYAEECKIEDKAMTTLNLMKNMKWTLEETLDNMGVSDKKERDVIAKLLQE